MLCSPQEILNLCQKTVLPLALNKSSFFYNQKVAPHLKATVDISALHRWVSIYPHTPSKPASQPTWPESILLNLSVQVGNLSTSLP